MKPSERIVEIFGKEEFNDKNVAAVVGAIIKYLDEQHELNKTPEQRQREFDLSPN